MPVRVVDELEVVEVEDDDGDHARGGAGLRDLSEQALLRSAMVEQAGEPIGGDLRAQRVALAGGVVGQGGHRGEALDEDGLGVGEGGVLPRAVDVDRPDHASVHEQRHAYEGLGLLVSAGDGRAERLGERVGHVAGAAVAHGPARDAAAHVDAVGHHLLHPGADREDRTQALPARLDLVDREVVVGQQPPQVLGDPAEGLAQRIGREDAGSGVEQRVERRGPGCAVGCAITVRSSAGAKRGLTGEDPRLVAATGA